MSPLDWPGARGSGEHAFCWLWLKKDEPVVLPALCGEEGGALRQLAPHRTPATSRMTKPLASVPFSAGHFPLGALDGKGRASSTGDSDPHKGVYGHGLWAWKMFM